MKISIIIKALNEEKHIENCIKSCIEAAKGFKYEIILADSLSTDRTVEIATKYPVKIVQLTNPKERSCGVGAQLGYQYSKGDFIYLIDGDMTLHKSFIKKAIWYLEKERNLAGVGGNIIEANSNNLVFEQRKNRKLVFGEVDYLIMGGLYRRRGIQDVEYFTNKNFHCFEEFELGYRLMYAGWKMKRINQLAVTHYGHTESSLKLLFKWWKTKYIFGCGEFIRSAIGKNYFLKAISWIKIEILVILAWAFIIILLIDKKFIEVSIIIVILLSILVIVKHTINRALFTVVYRHLNILAVLFSFTFPYLDPKQWIKSRVIKNK